MSSDASPTTNINLPQLARLRSIDDEIGALQSRIESGEPPPASLTLRTRIGSFIKRRLNRLLWWQRYQVNALTNITLQRGREETKTIEDIFVTVGHLSQQVREMYQMFDALSEKTKLFSQQMQEIYHIISNCKRQVRESENRLRELELAQSVLQSAESERNARNTEQLEIARTSLCQEFKEVKEAMRLAEAHIADQMLRETSASLQKIDELAQRVESETAQKEQFAARLAELARQIESETADKEQMATRLSELGMFTYQNRASLNIQDRRLTVFFEEARKRSAYSSTDVLLHEIGSRQADHKYDSLYLAFEDTFRGSREEIKMRQNAYLPFLKGHAVGSKSMPILDLGCGRGEWLELLREHGLEACGLDLNETMVEHCKSASFQVVQDDALSYLGRLPDACLGAVTSFHMIEHMPFEVVLALVDESLRVLKSGGILIFETPNPQNILVGAYSFHLDPSHVKPLPSPMLRFFVEARGFCDVKVWDLHPFPEVFRFPEDGKGTTHRLNEYFYGSQDYAVLGRRP